MDIIKNLLSFDERNQHNLIGGAIPGAVGAVAVAVGSVGSPVGSVGSVGAVGAPEGKEGDPEGKEGENNNSKNDSESLGDLYEMIKKTIINVYEWLKGGIMNWIVVPIVFGSFAPAMPFMFFMALLFGVMKYFVNIFRKL